MTAPHPATRPVAPYRPPVVVALGGNALRRDVATAVESIADLAADHDVVVTHGEAPHGAIAQRLEHGLSAALPGCEVAAVHLHSVVDAAELRTIRWLVAEGALVICGGGSTPVIVDTAAPAAGVDHDLATALLAACLGAEALLLLTDVHAVERDWGTPHARALRRATPADLRSMAFADGSMRPKVHAACRFVEATGGVAAIGAPADARALLDGRSGTTVQTTHGRLWSDCDAARHRLSLVPAAVARSLEASPEGLSA
jgi:carbamate kinase